MLLSVVFVAFAIFQATSAIPKPDDPTAVSLDSWPIKAADTLLKQLQKLGLQVESDLDADGSDKSGNQPETRDNEDEIGSSIEDEMQIINAMSRLLGDFSILQKKISKLLNQL